MLTSTPAAHLLHKGFSRFPQAFIEKNLHLLGARIDPERNRGLEYSRRAAFRSQPLKTSPEVELMETSGKFTAPKGQEGLKTSPEVELMETSEDEPQQVQCL